MPQADSIDTTNPSISREQVESHIDALIDLLDHLDPDPDLEPSLGFTDPQAWYGETQDGPSYAGNANAGDDREEDDEREPPVDDEPSLGWLGSGLIAEQANQDGHEHFWANHDSGSGLEEDRSDDEPDVDDERNLGWANEGHQGGEWFAEHQEQEAGSPEWPAEPPVRKRPTRRSRRCRGGVVTNEVSILHLDKSRHPGHISRWRAPLRVADIKSRQGSPISTSSYGARRARTI